MKKKRAKRDQDLHLLVTSEEKAAYQQAADDTDHTLSDWIRRTLRAELTQLRGSEDKRK